MILVAWGDGVGSNWTGFGGMEGVRQRAGMPELRGACGCALRLSEAEARTGEEEAKALAEVFSAERRSARRFLYPARIRAMQEQSEEQIISRLFELENGGQAERRAELSGERFISLIHDPDTGRAYVFSHSLDETEGPRFRRERSSGNTPPRRRPLGPTTSCSRSRDRQARSSKTTRTRAWATLRPVVRRFAIGTRPATRTHSPAMTSLRRTRLRPEH